MLKVVLLEYIVVYFINKHTKVVLMKCSSLGSVSEERWSVVLNFLQTFMCFPVFLYLCCSQKQLSFYFPKMQFLSCEIAPN